MNQVSGFLTQEEETTILDKILVQSKKIEQRGLKNFDMYFCALLPKIFTDC